MVWGRDTVLGPHGRVQKRLSSATELIWSIIRPELIWSIVSQWSGEETPFPAHLPCLEETGQHYLLGYWRAGKLAVAKQGPTCVPAPLPRGFLWTALGWSLFFLIPFPPEGMHGNDLRRPAIPFSLSWPENKPPCFEVALWFLFLMLKYSKPARIY